SLTSSRRLAHRLNARATQRDASPVPHLPEERLQSSEADLRHGWDRRLSRRGKANLDDFCRTTVGRTVEGFEFPLRDLLAVHALQPVPVNARGHTDDLEGTVLGLTENHSLHCDQSSLNTDVS